jgi:hypothetical protein
VQDTESRFEEIEHVLATRGQSFGLMRVAVTRRGVSVGFPRDPMLHVSWRVISAIVAIVLAVRLARQR